MAIDDLGMGFSGLNRILESSPDELKLDASVVRDIDTRLVKRALVEAFCSFGERAGFGIVAEGIETAAELATLQDIGADIGQGYHLPQLGMPPRRRGAALSVLISFAPTPLQVLPITRISAMPARGGWESSVGAGPRTITKD